MGIAENIPIKGPFLNEDYDVDDDDGDDDGDADDADIMSRES